MARRLPSLNGLRAFEAAGRHGSFTAAAQELNVTQAAVSRMVRLLERRLGYALFRRHANALELTAQGQALLSGVTDSFDSIARLADQVAAMRAGPVLTVGVGPALAVNWLIPRLTNFYRIHPDVEVRMATGGATLPVRDDWTCTVRRDAAAWPGYIAEPLFPSALVPVCTPAIASGLRRPSDLHGATLIFVPHLANEWPCWFEAAGLSAPARPLNEALFGHNAMAMQAVLDGVGVAVAQLCYVSDALAAGRLVAPFPVVAHTGESWFLEYRPVRREDPALLAFRDWLLREAERQSRVEAELVARPIRPASRKQASTQSPPQRKRQPNLMRVGRARRPPPRTG
jgi:LysR family transcriptional regulator, regulator of gene expression of beta-lactamase